MTPLEQLERSLLWKAPTEKLRACGATISSRQSNKTYKYQTFVRYIASWCHMESRLQVEGNDFFKRGEMFKAADCRSLRSSEFAPLFHCRFGPREIQATTTQSFLQGHPSQFNVMQLQDITFHNDFTMSWGSHEESTVLSRDEAYAWSQELNDKTQCIGTARWGPKRWQKPRRSDTAQPMKFMTW